MQLLPHQEVGRDFLVTHDRALLADGMRVGKSVQTIAACDHIRPFGVIVVCPASLREQWRRQFKQFSTKGLEPYVLSYEEAVKLASRVAGNVINDIDVLVLDESHYIKNRKSKRTKAVLDGLAPHARRVWCLTGTPSPNNASELWPMLHALFPETIQRNGKTMNYWEFTKRFCVVKSTPFGEKIEGNRNTEELRERMAPIMLRRPSSILGNTILPPETLYLDASAAELKRLEKQLREELGEAAMKADPETLDNQVKARAGRLAGLAKVPALVERLKDEFESGLDKVVIFAWHTDVINALADGLACFEPAVVTGDTPMHTRQKLVDNFQRGHLSSHVFIGNIKAAGVGLDLTAACELIFAETSWVPGDNEQAAMRITGVNQKRAARVRYAVLPGSIDERLMAVNVRKSQDIAALFG